MAKKVFAFDLGKVSIGYCVREDFSIKGLGSVIINIEHAEVVSNRDRRRVFKTLEAHKARERFFDELWEKQGLEILSKEDERFKKEFPNKKEDTIFTSCLLRIALLQGKKLENWQIYKALHNAIQNRGYDANLAWANAKSDDDKKNEEYMKKYTQSNDTELIKAEDYKYPCYYDALRLGLWNEENSDRFNKNIPLADVIKVRDTGMVAPRRLIEKELTRLWQEAQKQIPQLKHISVEYFLYGEFGIAYGSYKIPEYKRYRGRKEDWQGVLGQKVPRFNNRIIMKCKLLPKRNVSAAETLENTTFTLLMKLKNLRITDKFGEKRMLSADEINQIYENWKDKVVIRDSKLDTTITKDEIAKVTGRIQEKFEPLKANISGRSSFCRRACAIMNKIILEGIENPIEMDVSEFIDKPTCPNPITEIEIRKMLAKIGTWENLFVPDSRYDVIDTNSDERERTDSLIGSITNSIVRNRLQIIRDLILGLKKDFGEPDEVIFEFVRDGADKSLMPGKKAKDTEKYMKQQEKYNEEIANKLKDVNAYSLTNFDKLKLLEMQDGRCIYSGVPIGISDFEKCEIDHIYPRSNGGNDALYNRVLCYSMENQKKGGKTPYEWLHNNEEAWFDYTNRISKIKDKLGKKKYVLLTSSPELCEKEIESYNALAETAQIARLAQSITASIFGWGLQTKGDKRRIFVNNGSSTAAIRKTYRLNKLLGDDIKKNRDNDKHHALDAICISFSRDYKYNREKNEDEIKGLNPEIIARAIEDLIPYPYSNDKPCKANTKPLETIYGSREINGKFCITKRTALDVIEQKENKIKTIVDEIIKQDLLNKLDEKMTQSEWAKMLKEYYHPKKGTLVKKVLTVESIGEKTQDLNGRIRIGEFVDFGTKGVKGQFKHSKAHKGQILYYNEKGAIKVMPIYANIKTQDVKDKLINMGCKLYNKGQVFYSGCLLDIPNEFNAGSNTCPAGIYKLRTIRSNGQTKLENSCGAEIVSGVTNLVAAKFKKLDKNKK